MKNKVLLISFVLFHAVQLSAMDKPSIYDPMGALSSEERSRIEAEGRTVIANRKVNGQNLLIQIDFLSEDEFDEGGVTRRDGSGRTLFSLGTYTNWSMRYFSQPAILILFIDQGDGNYALDALNFSDMLMDEGIPDLVRRYIRDEIMKKETSYVEIISSGLHAIQKALYDKFKSDLIQLSLELLSKNYFYRGYTYNDLNYYYFLSEHEKVDLGCNQLYYWVDNKYHSLFILESCDLNCKITSQKASILDYLMNADIGYLDNIHGMNDYLVVVNSKNDEGFFYMKEDKLYPLNKINYNFDYFNFDNSEDFLSKGDLNLKGEGRYPQLIKSLNEIDNHINHFESWQFVPGASFFTFSDHIKNCSCRVKVITGRKYKGEKYTTLEGLSTYGRMRFKNAQVTMCNHYASELSTVYGKSVPSNKSSKDITDYFNSTNDYINLKEIYPGSKEIYWKYINMGYPVYFSKAGHIETGYPSGQKNIGYKEYFEDDFALGPYSGAETTDYHTIGSGAQVGMKSYDHFSFLKSENTGAYLFLGYLKKK